MGRTVMCICLLVFLAPGLVRAHCQVPCGIYDDPLRLEMLREHVVTIRTAMEMIDRLEKKKAPDRHQIVRWIMTKEEHARAFQEVVAVYFLTQRIKPGGTDARYVKMVTLLHEMLVSAMKCKQGVERAHVERLSRLVEEFAGLYLAPQK